jgi:hypothetical protein
MGINFFLWIPKWNLLYTHLDRAFLFMGDNYGSLLWVVFEYGLLPISASLVFLVAAYRERKEPLKDSTELITLTFGGLAGLGGTMNIFSAYASYTGALESVSVWHVPEIVGSLQVLIGFDVLVDILWLIAAALLVLIARGKTIKGQEDTNKYVIAGNWD